MKSGMEHELIFPREGTETTLQGSEPKGVILLVRKLKNIFLSPESFSIGLF